MTAARLARMALGFLVLACATVAAQESPSASLSARVDRVFERMDKPTSPGCALAVIREGRIVYTRGYGMANLDHDIVITPSSIFHVASVSKQFTAAAILLLAQDGKLTLDDDVRKYVPELPDFGKTITIRHLIHHTSGLRDQWDLLSMAGWRYSRDLITDEDVLQLMARQKDLNFQTGEEYQYCNTGYTLLATIVKRASGQTFREFTAARLFRPLGMTRTFFRDDHAEIIKGQAYGYVPAGDSFRLSLTNFDTAGATSLHTTVEDLALWDRNLYDGRVGGHAFLEAQLKKGSLNSGETIPYASGLQHETYRGLPTVGHGGADAGYRADYLRFPGERFSVVCLCNLSTSNPPELTRRVADIYLADRLGPASAPDDRPGVTLSAEDLSRHAGLYWQRGRDQFRRLVVRNGKLELGFGEPGAPLKPLGGGRFGGPASDLLFEPTPAGRMRVTETARNSQAKPIVFEAVDPFVPTPAQLAEYAGTYRSEEIEPPYRLAIVEGRLVLQRLKFEPVTLEPLTRDVFRSSGPTVRFTRDEKGRVAGCTMSMGRVRGFRFTRNTESR